MAKVVRESSFRQLLVQSRGSRDAYSELAVSQAPTNGEIISASATFICFANATATDLSVVGVKEAGAKRTRALPVLKGHLGGPVLDTDFSLVDYNLLASGGSDASCRIWRMPATLDELYSQAEYSATSVLEHSSRAVQQVAWHPSCAGLLATAAGAHVRVWDVETQGVVAEFTSLGGDVHSLAWSWNGASLALGCPSDKSMLVVDPRQASSSPPTVVRNAHAGPKSIVCEWGAPNDYSVYTTGMDQSQGRELCAWDLRSVKERGSLVRVRVDTNTGVLRPLFDADTGLLYVAGHGDANIRVYEADDKSPYLHPIGNFIMADAARSVTLLPKAACDIMGCEVNRVLRLMTSAIEGVRCEVPRKRAAREFQADLFPETRAPVQTLSVAQYTANENAPPARAPVKSLAVDFTTSEDTVTRVHEDDQRSQEEIEQERAQRAEQERLDQEERDRLAEKNSELDSKFSKFLGYQAKMKFTKTEQARKDDSFYNLTPETGTPDTTNIACSAKFFVVPWKGAAGPIYVGDMDKPGKLANPTDFPGLLRGHTSVVNAVAFDEFDDRVFASGADDCSIRVWRLPEGGVHTADDAQAALASSTKFAEGHRLSCRAVAFHRVAKGVLTSFGSEPGVKLWDVEKGACVKELGESVFGSSPASGFDWSYDGSQIVVAGRDSVVRACDARTAKSVFTQVQAHEGLKGIKVAWLGPHPNWITTGFSKTGAREFKMWDARQTHQPMNVTQVDAGSGMLLPHYVEDNGVLVLVAKGEHTIRVFEIEGIALAKDIVEVGKKREPHKFQLHKCTEHRASGEPAAGLAFLPRRCVNVGRAEWLRGVRLTPTSVEPISMTVPRAQDIQGYFFDDLFPPARSATPAIATCAEFMSGASVSGPKVVNLNTSGMKILSERPEAEAHQSIKKGVANTDRMKREHAEQEAKKKETQEAMDRMQKLAVQHEKYNPNVSKPRGEASNEIKNTDADAVKDEEWGD